MLSSEGVGWQETRFNTAVTAGTPVLAITNTDSRYQIVVHRIRGSCAYDVTLKSGTSVGTAAALSTPKIKASDYIDIPGLYLPITAGHNLYVDVASNDTPDIAIQWSAIRVGREQNTGTISIGS